MDHNHDYCQLSIHVTIMVPWTKSIPYLKGAINPCYPNDLGPKRFLPAGSLKPRPVCQTLCYPAPRRAKLHQSSSSTKRCTWRHKGDRWSSADFGCGSLILKAFNPQTVVEKNMKSWGVTCLQAWSVQPGCFARFGGCEVDNAGDPQVALAIVSRSCCWDPEPAESHPVGSIKVGRTSSAKKKITGAFSKTHGCVVWG